MYLYNTKTQTMAIPILVAMLVLAVLAGYILTIVDIEKQKFHFLRNKARLLTLIRAFPIGGALYYWVYKKQLVR